jgi:endo-1,4-beta-mannosidase
VSNVTLRYTNGKLLHRKTSTNLLLKWTTTMSGVLKSLNPD